MTRTPRTTPFSRLRAALTERITRMTTDPNLNPDGPAFYPLRDLPAGTLPCALCGVPVAMTEDRDTITVLSLGSRRNPNSAHPEALLRHAQAPETTLTMTRCDTCGERRAAAVLAVAEFPEGRGRFRQAVLAEDAAELATATAAAIGVQLVLGSARALRFALDYLAPLGHGLTWRGRYSPRMVAAARRDEAASAPFSAVDPELLDEARRTFVEMLAARTARVVSVAEPGGSGCYLCGVGAVEVLSSAKARAWTTLRLRPETVGGRGGDLVVASVCWRCNDEFERQERTVGDRLMQVLVLRAAGLENHLAARDLILRPTAWGVLGRREPNQSPWQHLDLAGLRADIESGQTGIEVAR